DTQRESRGGAPPGRATTPPAPSAPTTLPATTVRSSPKPVAVRKDRRLVPVWCCSIPSSSEALAGDQRRFIAVEKAGRLPAPVCQALRPRRGPVVGECGCAD